MLSPARRLRLAMTVTTALTGGVVLAGVAGAQSVSLPNPASAVITIIPGAGIPNISLGNSTTLNVVLNAKSSVITWNDGFNIPEKSSVNFYSAIGAGTPQAVLNIDANARGLTSQLLGNLYSDKNVAVWIYNPNGIVAGSNATIHTGSLVLTTLAGDSNAFLKNGADSNFSANFTGVPGAKGIHVNAGATISVEGGNRGLVLVAPEIVADAAAVGGRQSSFTATGQDAAFVVANDVTVNFAANSPLSVVLTKGTAIASATASVISGTVSGQNVLFALASQTSVTDALLQVNASVTTASANGNGIVLSAGAPATPFNGVTVAGAVADTGGAARLIVAGPLNSAAQALIGASAAVNVVGSVTAASDYRVTGGSVALGGNGPVAQTAGGAVAVTATNGAITGAPNLTLTSGGALSLVTTGPGGTDINFAPGSKLMAGNNGQATLAITLHDQAGTVSLGDVTAGALTSAIGTAAQANGLSVKTALTVGAVKTASTLVLNANGINAGSLTSNGGVALSSSAGLSAGSISAGDAVTATAGGTLSVASGVMARGDVSLTGAALIVPQVTSSANAVRLTSTTGDVRVNRLSAGGDVVVDAAAMAGISDNVTAGGAYRVTGTGVTLGSPAFGVTQSAAGAVAITAGAGGITGAPHLLLRSDSAGVGGKPLSLTVTDPGAAIAFDPMSTLATGNRQSDLAIRTADTGSALSLGTVTAGNLFGASGGGPLTSGLVRTGALTIGDVTLNGPLSLQAPGISAGALSSDTSVALNSAGAITASSIRAGGAVTLTGTGNTVVGFIGTTGAGGNVAIDRAGILSVGGFGTSGDVTLGAMTPPTSITVKGASTIGGTLTAMLTGAQSWGGAINAGAVMLGGSSLTVQDVFASAGGVALTTSAGDLTTGNIAANAALTLNSTGTIFAGALKGASVSLGTSGAITAGSVTSTGTDVGVSGGTMSLGGVSAARDATLTAATGGLSFGNAVNAGRNLTASAPGDVAFNGGTVGGVFQVTAGGVASLGGTVSAGSLQLTGASVALGAGATIASAGSVDLNATTGGISGGSGLRLASTSTDPTQFIRLQATGTAGVAFAPDSSITAPALRVAVFNADPAATLTLGAVNARALVGLTAASSDPVTGATALSAVAPVFGALTLRDAFTARATGGDLTVGSLAVSGAGQGIDLAATGALKITSAASADGDVLLASGMPLNLASVTSASGRVSVTSGGALSVGTLSGAGGVTASGTTLNVGAIGGGAAVLSTTAGQLSLGGGNASAASLTSVGGDVTVSGALTLTGALSVQSNADAVLGGTVRAGSASVTGNSVRAADLGTTGALLVTARTGDVTGAIAGTGATLTTAGGDLDVFAAAGGATLARATGGRVRVNAGTVAVSNATGSGDVLLTATGDAQVLGPVTAGGNYLVSGRSVVLNGIQSAGSAVTVVATGGPLTGLSGLVLSSDALGRGNAPLALSATGGAVSLDKAATLNGGAARQSTVTVDAKANAITLGAVNARALVVNGGVRTDAAITTGALSLTDPLVLLGGAGGVSTGAVTVAAGGATLDAGVGALSTGAVQANSAALTGARVDFATLTAGDVKVNAGASGLRGGAIVATGPVALSSGGTLDVASLTTTGSAGNVAVGAQGALTLGAVNASGTASVATSGSGPADVVLNGGLTAVGDVQVASTHDIRSPFVTSTTGKLTVTAPNGSATGLNAGDAIALSAGTGGGLAVTVGGDVRLGALTGGPVSLAARSISAISIDVGSNLVNLAATGGDLSIGGGVTAGAVTLTATGATSVGGAINASGAVKLAGSKALTLGDVTGGTVMLSSGGMLGAGTITGASVGVTGGSVTLTRVASTGGATLAASGGDLTLGGAKIGGDLNASASGSLLLQSAVTAGGAAVLTGTGGLSFTDVSGASVNASSKGAISGGTVTGGAVGVSGASVKLTGITSTGGATLAANAGDLSLGSATVATDFTASASGGVSLTGAVTAGGALKVTGGQSLTFTDLTGGVVTLMSGGALTGKTLTGGGIGATGGSVSLTRVASTGNTTLAASAGDLVLGGGKAGGDLNASASGAVSFGGPVTAGGMLQVAGMRGLGFTDLTGGAVMLTSGGAIGGGTVTGGSVTVTGGGVQLASLTSTGAATLTASGGDVMLGSASVAGDFGATASGLVSLGGAVNTVGAVKLAGMGGVSFGDLGGGAVSVTSAGAVKGGTLTAASANVNGATVTLTRVASTGGATLAAGAGDLNLGSATTVGDLAVSASGLVSLPGAVSAGGAYLVRGGTVALGAAGVTQAAGGRVDITSTGGGITGASGLTLVSDSGNASPAGTLVLDSAGALAFGGTLIQAGPGGGAALGLNAGAGQSVTVGRVEAASVGGVDAAHSDFTGAFTHAGNVTLGDVAAGRVAIVLTAGDLQLGKVTAPGSVALATAGALTTGAISAGAVDLSAGNALTAGDVLASGSAKVAGGDIALASLTASGGDVTATARGTLGIGSVGARGAATLNGATVQLDSVSAGTLAVTATGDLTGRAGGRAALTSTGGDLNIQTGGQARLASLSSAGAATVNAGSVDVAGQLGAARALLVKARAALNVGGATSAGSDATLSAGGAATLGAVTAGGAVSITGAGVTAQSASAGSTLALTSTGDLTLGGGQAGGAATIDAGGLATLGQLVAGPSISILASDAELNGTQRAAAVTITNRAPTTRALRLGDGTASDGFRLSAAELGRIDAATLTLDGGTGAVELGTTAFAAGAGSQAVKVLSTGAITVDGAVTALGTGRNFTIGGSPTGTDATASAINIVATSTAGGRVMLADNNLELRGNRIAAGLAAGFVDALTSGGTATASNLVNNAASSLYNANLGGGFYDASAGTLLSARSLTVRYTDYALFQNTGLPGTTAGLVLGGSMTSPVAPALSLLPSGGGQNSFALFGTINGVGQTAAALLGPDVLSIGNANRASTRINGCLVGSGGGCLSTVTIQPTLQVFHVTASDVFGAAADLTVPFDPVIGGGNEVMLNGTDLAARETPPVSAAREPVVTGSAHP